MTLDGSGSTSGSNVWYALPAARREAIGLILLYSDQLWDKSVSVTTTKKDSNPNVPLRIATQFLIYEIVCGLRDPNTFESNSTNECGTSGDIFYNAGAASVPYFAPNYNTLVDTIQSAKKIPSFTSSSSGSAPTITLKGEETSVTDTNGVLSSFSFMDGNGAEFYKSGNTLYITQTGTISESTVFKATRYLPSASGSSFNLWYMTGSSYQTTISLCRASSSNLNAYFKVLVKSISRFARNTTECLEAIRELKSLGISIYFEEHNIDTKMVSSEMLTAVIASCAQAESESISQNMRWGVQNRMESGTFNTCRAATGFQLSENGLKIVPEEAPVICGIFADYLQGKNFREIAARLNGEKTLGRVWNRKLVDYILTNERYAGNALLQKKYRTDSFPRVKKQNRGERPMYYVCNSNPAIIPQEMFDQAAHLRSSRRIEVSGADVRPFTKRLYCGCCGSLCRSKKTNDTWYWVCRKHEEAHSVCEMPPVPEDAITAAFQRLYYNLKHNPEVLSYHMKQLIAVQNRQMLWSPAVVELNKEISDLLSQSYTLALLNKQGLVDPDIFISKSNQLAEQLRNAKG